MKVYIFLLKILLLMMIFLAPLKVLGSGLPNLYMILALALPIFIFLIFAFCVLKKRVLIDHVNQIIIYYIAVFLWMILGSYNGYDVLPEVSSLCIMMLSLMVICIAYNEGLIRVEYVKKIAYFLMYCWSGVYAIIGIGIIFQVIPNDIVMKLIAIWLESKPHTAMDSGFLGIIPRLGSGENILPLIIYAYYLIDKRAGSAFVWLLMFVYVLVDYGRIDMVFFVFLTLLFVYVKFFQGKISLQKGVTAFMSLLVILIFVYTFLSFSNINMDEFISGWTERYGRESTERYIQVKYLTDYMSANLWFGYGLGAYTPEYIRSDNAWVYEMQFHAFLMQMGIIGGIAIIVNYLIFFFRMVFTDIPRKYVLVTVACLAYWLVDSGFQGGVFYGVGRIVCIVMYMFTRQEVFEGTGKGGTI